MIAQRELTVGQRLPRTGVEMLSGFFKRDVLTTTRRGMDGGGLGGWRLAYHAWCFGLMANTAVT